MTQTNDRTKWLKFSLNFVKPKICNRSERPTEMLQQFGKKKSKLRFFLQKPNGLNVYCRLKNYQFFAVCSIGVSLIERLCINSSFLSADVVVSGSFFSFFLLSVVHFSSVGT